MTPYPFPVLASGILPQLGPVFQPYWIPPDARAKIFADQGSGLYRATQRNYMPTFNYGDPPTVNHATSHDQRSFEHIQWNAWEADMLNRYFTNRFIRAGQVGYIQTNQNTVNRITLDMRINDTRQAYRPNPTDTNAVPPNIILMAHSMGGLLSHYYLLKKPNDHGVRRLVTLATPHLGSHVANWLTWWNAYPGLRVQNGKEAQYVTKIVTNKDSLVGYFIHGDRGAVWDLNMVDNRNTTPANQRGRNPLMDFFWSQPAPKIEYVFNVYQRPTSMDTIGSISIAINENPASEESDRGDGVVPLYSASAKTNAADVSIWNGRTNQNGNHDIDPVIFGIWPNLDHVDAPHDTNSILKSLLGVPYHWPGSTTNIWPVYAQRYGENQSFSKYFSSPSSGSTAYTDEPGIKDLKLLYQRAGENSMLVPAFDTYTTSSSGPQKTLTNAADFASHQIISGTGGGFVQYLGTAGTKNRSQNPVGTSGTNYWVQEGNEYLPASLMIDRARGETPQTVATTINMLASPKAIVTNCLVQLTNGTPQYQYGYFEGPFDIPISLNTNNYVAVQGYNIANLLTPQAERAFNTPVESATLITILNKINHGEALSNACHNAGTITLWKATVSEWATSDTGTITLDFFPTSKPPKVFDAWANTPYTDLAYNPTNNTITLNDPTNAPSQLIISNEVYLGCEKVFTNSYGGIVPKLDDVNLAGVQITPTQLDQIRTALAGILSKYKDTTSATCTNWTKANIIKQADPAHTQTDWTPIVSNLLEPKHFTELKAVTDLLATEISCCGACCLTNGNCAQLLQCACTNQSGIYQGDATVCSNVHCTGACCDTNGNCTTTTQANCPSPKVFHGLGTTCTPTNPCPHCIDQTKTYSRMLPISPAAGNCGSTISGTLESDDFPFTPTPGNIQVTVSASFDDYGTIAGISSSTGSSCGQPNGVPSQVVPAGDVQIVGNHLSVDVQATDGPRLDCCIWVGWSASITWHACP